MKTKLTPRRLGELVVATAVLSLVMPPVVAAIVIAWGQVPAEKKEK